MKILVAGLLTLALMAVCATAFSSMQFRHRSLSGQMRNRLANVTAPPTNYWFEQKLDHFNPLDARVFRQRYWMNDTFADGKTLLFAFAGEAPLQDFYGVSDNFLTLLCQQNNMLLIYIEHRFYGESVPEHDSSTTHLGYLTTNQALEDAVNFIYWATALNGIPKLVSKPKIITFGCSYSGMLSAFFRQKYSWLTVGAISGSAPVLSVLDFPGYDNTVKSVLASQGNNCDGIVQSAFDQIVSIYNSPNGTSTLRKLFNVCPVPASFSLADLTSSLSGFVDVQGNNPDAGFPVTVMCNQLAANAPSMGPLQAYRAYVQSQDPSCIDVDALAGVKAPGSDRSWTWQTCTEYGFFQTDVQSEIFGGSIHLDFFTDLCTRGFGNALSDAPNTAATNYRFGGMLQSQSSWIIFSNGLQDPWGSNLGINTPLGPTLNVSLSTSAHCAAYHPPSPNDPPNLVQSRIDIANFVAQALSQN